jgi:hypothetical protein
VSYDTLVVSVLTQWSNKHRTLIVGFAVVGHIAMADSPSSREPEESRTSDQSSTAATAHTAVGSDIQTNNPNTDPRAEWTTSTSELTDSDSDDRYDLTFKSKTPKAAALDYKRSLSTILQSESDGVSLGPDDEAKNGTATSNNNIPVITVAPLVTADTLVDSPVTTPGETPSTIPVVGDGLAAPKSNMIVETETVPAVATVAVTTTGNLNAGSSLKIKKSTDNVTRTSNRKKKKSRQVLGSKAEIFAAKIASAVDEAAHSSDSDETFVYESNPPESQRPKWSRNPSASSLALDPYQTLTGTRRSKLPLGREEERARESNELDYSDRERASLQGPPPAMPLPGSNAVSESTATDQSGASAGLGMSNHLMPNARTNSKKSGLQILVLRLLDTRVIITLLK